MSDADHRPRDTTNSQEPQLGQSQSQDNATALGLPQPDAGGPAHKFDMSSGSDTVSLDHLGPMVVNVDGSLGRITNWAEMNEIERKNTVRVLGKRNKARLDALKEKGEM